MRADLLTLINICTHIINSLQRYHDNKELSNIALNGVLFCNVLDYVPKGDGTTKLPAPHVYSGR